MAATATLPAMLARLCATYVALATIAPAPALADLYYPQMIHLSLTGMDGEMVCYVVVAVFTQPLEKKGCARSKSSGHRCACSIPAHTRARAFALADRLRSCQSRGDVPEHPRGTQV